MDQRTDLLVHISELYYQQNLSQNEIAKILGLSRPTISRLLEEARSSGVVEIIVHSPIHKDAALSAQLRKKLHLREAIVVSGKYNHDTALSRCAEVAASFLSTIIDNNVSIGITWGRAAFAFCNAIKPKDFYNVNVVQMAGCLGTGNPHIDGIELALNVAKKFNGTYSNIIAPIYVDNQIVYDHLLASPQIKSTLKKASQVDIAVTGIGTLDDEQSALIQAGCYTEDERLLAIQKGAVGHILARQFDKNGKEIPLASHFPISAPLSSMRSTEWSIGICATAEKAAAVLAAIKGRYVNAVVIDEPLAFQLLKLIDNKEA